MPIGSSDGKSYEEQWDAFMSQYADEEGLPPTQPQVTDQFMDHLSSQGMEEPLPGASQEVWQRYYRAKNQMSSSYSTEEENQDLLDYHKLITPVDEDNEPTDEHAFMGTPTWSQISEADPSLLSYGYKQYAQVSPNLFGNTVMSDASSSFTTAQNSDYTTQPVVRSTPDRFTQTFKQFSPAQLRNFETKLNKREEADFQTWKQKYAPNDSGFDYDLRGAFIAGMKPAADGHWPDEFKKPNHPTFSNESRYAKDYPELAGRWEGSTFVPPGEDASLPQGAKNMMAVIPAEHQEAYAQANANFEERWQSTKDFMVTPKAVEDSVIKLEGSEGTQEPYYTWPERMMQSLWAGITAPGDAYQGKLDPASDEAIARAFDLAGTITFGSMPMAYGRKAATFNPPEMSPAFRQWIAEYTAARRREREPRGWGLVEGSDLAAINKLSFLEKPLEIGRVSKSVLEKVAQAEERTGVRTRFVYTPSDGEVVKLDVVYTPEIQHLYVSSISSESGMALTQGTKETRNLLKLLRQAYPEAETITGYRVTGARTKTGKGAARASMRLRAQE